MAKYKKGDRFVIEIGDVVSDKGLYRIDGFKTLIFDDDGLDRLKKASEVDEEPKELTDEDFGVGDVIEEEPLPSKRWVITAIYGSAFHLVCEDGTVRVEHRVAGFYNKTDEKVALNDLEMLAYKGHRGDATDGFCGECIYDDVSEYDAPCRNCSHRSTEFKTSYWEER